MKGLQEGLWFTKTACLSRFHLFSHPAYYHHGQRSLVGHIVHGGGKRVRYNLATQQTTKQHYYPTGQNNPQAILSASIF